MVMRLVRDDDYYDSPMTLDPEEQTSRAGHGSAAATDDADADSGADSDAAADTQLLDPQDGTAIDAADEAEDAASDGNGAATAPQVDLAPLEALLLSTHHPLTAGRLAELLGLETTKPLRKAIKALNEQYASTGRCFRIEQVA